MKVGVLTQYYKSNNYGGVLQAYALVRYLRSIGFDAEQLSYDMKGLNDTLVYKIKVSLRKIYNSFQLCIYKNANKSIAKRNSAMISFREDIPHSIKVFTDLNITESNQMYDAFIVGSDQVWLPRFLDSAFFLGFADESKKRISYAASMSINEISKELKSKYISNFSNFEKVSVREENMISIISSMLSIPVELVLDPVFLIEQNEWKKITSERIIPEKYMFCYFLGDDKKMRSLAKLYAKEHNLILVNIPYLQGKFRNCDRYFGEISLSDISPNRFLSLLYYADCVFTDSFHAVAFSIIFQKQFFAFSRSNYGFNTRISSLTHIFHCEERFITEQEKMSVEYLSDLDDIVYKEMVGRLNDQIIKSKEYLIKSLCG